MTKSDKELFEIRKGKLALRQIREVTKLLDKAGVPEFVEIDDGISNGPQCRLKWFLMRRKDVQVCELTNQEREAIGLLVRYGVGGKTGMSTREELKSMMGIDWKQFVKINTK